MLTLVEFAVHRPLSLRACLIRWEPITKALAEPPRARKRQTELLKTLPP